MDLSPSTTITTPVEAQKLWLASKHGTDCMDTITLDLSHASWTPYKTQDPQGVGRSYVRSGIPVKKSGTTYQVAATGSAADGFLFETVFFNSASTKAGGSLLWHGEVNGAQVVAIKADFSAATDKPALVRVR